MIILYSFFKSDSQIVFFLEKCYTFVMEKLAGVYETKKKNGQVYYRSSLTFKGRHLSLGSFDTAEDAHECYLEGTACLSDEAITLQNYKPRFLAFEKVVSLLNFRDNHLYFATPIYVKKNYFYYYFSKYDFLIFDIDDLFYYSHHKIMRRGGHLFVADYGMQVNILNRYGIKNYGVKGRDYLFRNGDETDYRYENIEVINKYHGVAMFTKNNNIYYKAKLHMKSNYVIGTYTSETEAAIAYNKAVDIVHANGISKNFPQNYIDGISPKVYAEIYSNLVISESIYNIKQTENKAGIS